MPIDETGETKLRTACLNFNVCLCIKIKKFKLEEEDIKNIILWDFRSRFSSKSHKIS